MKADALTAAALLERRIARLLRELARATRQQPKGDR